MTFSAVALIAGLVVQAAPPAASPTPDTLGQAYFLFVEALRLDGKGDVAGAIAGYRKAIELAPASADAHAELAGLYARENRAGDAVTESLAALKLDPDNWEAHRILGFVQSALADGAQDAVRRSALIEEAVGHFEHALKGGGQDLGVQFSLGRLYVQTGRYTQGINTLRNFLLQQPGYPDALTLLAQAYENTHQPARAADALEELVASQPNQIRAKVWLAELYEQASRWKDAAALWTELSRATPRDLTYRIRRASAIANTGDLAAGRQALTEITRDSPREISAWFLLSQLERRAGDYAAADKAAQQIAAIDAKDLRAPLALAESKAARGDPRGVVDTLGPAVAAAQESDITNGVFAQIAGALATAWQSLGDRPRAVAVLEDARTRDPDNQGLLFDLVGAYEKADQLDRAEQVLRKVVAGDSQNAEALNSLGYLLADHDRKLDEAVDFIKRALALQADSPSYLDSLGWAYFKLNRFDDARAPLERAASALPKNSVILDHLGELYFQIKRYRDAADTWDKALAGDREGIDAAATTKKRDRARQLAGR